MKIKFAVLLSGAALAFATAPACAAVLTFDDVPLNGCSGVTTGGLSFTSGTSICTGSWENTPVSSNGTPALIYGYGSLNIASTTGDPFSIGSFLAGISYYSGLSTSTINYTLNFAGGGATAGSFEVGRGFGLINIGASNITFANFSGLSDGYVAIDNFDAAVSLPAVPEPTTWAMMLIGFGAVGGAMRSAKRRHKLTVSFA